MPLFSIIIPIYNVAPFLEQCLASIAGQSCRDLEIIGVDDASTDASAEILRKFSGLDARFHPIFHEQNKGTYQARKNGVLASTGKYILFVDADDWLEPNACEKIAACMREHPADILHIGVRLENTAKVAYDYLCAMMRTVQFPPGEMRGSEIIPALVAHKMCHHLTFKLFRGETCRRGFAELPDCRLYCSEDLLAFFFVSYFSRSFYGAKQLAGLYHYRLGEGIVSGTSRKLNKKQLDQFCNTAVIPEIMTDFLQKQNAGEEWFGYVRYFREHLLSVTMGRTLQIHDPQAASEILLRYWSPELVVPELYKIIESKTKQINLLRMNAEFIKKLPEPLRKCLKCYFERGLIETIRRISQKIFL